MSRFSPEGTRLGTAENAAYLTPQGLQKAHAEGSILEARALRCDRAHNLIVDLGGKSGVIPRNEAALGIAEGTTREIAILSRVGNPVSFLVTEAFPDGSANLSRRAAQEAALAYMMATLRPGYVIPAVVTHLEPFGAFVDIGCGVVSMISIERTAVSRIAHPSERFSVGQHIFAAVLDIDRVKRRIILTHRELLGTWEENAALFHPGETVTGIVRSIKPYGVFVELTPNLSGLAEYVPALSEGDAVSVYLKSILPDKGKVKLLVIDCITGKYEPSALRYWISGGHIDHWLYCPNRPGAPETVFPS